jgi:hypothetical protein
LLVDRIVALQIKTHFFHDILRRKKKSISFGIIINKKFKENRIDNDTVFQLHNFVDEEDCRVRKCRFSLCTQPTNECRSIKIECRGM